MTFLNENDALEIKINTCWDSVDKFIVLESNQTHTGDPKPYNLDVARFSKYKEKFNYFQMGSIDDAISSHPEMIGRRFSTMHASNPNETAADWVRDAFQAAFISPIIMQQGASDDDLILAQCCDEIVSPEAIDEARKLFVDKGKLPYFTAAHEHVLRSIPCQIEELGDAIDPIFGFEFLNYYYKVNMQNPHYRTIRQSLITTFRNLKLLNAAELRHFSIHTHPPIQNAGWHFGFLDAGDGLMALEKYKSWAHSRDINTNHYGTVNTKEEAVARLLEVCHLEKVSISYETHPKYLMDNLDKYRHIIQD